MTLRSSWCAALAAGCLSAACAEPQSAAPLVPVARSGPVSPAASGPGAVTPAAVTPAAPLAPATAAAPAHGADPGPAAGDFAPAEALAAAEAGVPAAAFLADIDQAAAAAWPRLPPDRLPAAQRPPLAAVHLPVLLPDDATLLPHALVTAGPDWYAASMPLGDVTVLVSGTRQGFESPDVPADLVPPTHARPLVLRNELIVDATFIAFGAAYTVAVECAAPDTDPRCTADAYVLDVVQKLRRFEAREVQP